MATRPEHLGTPQEWDKSLPEYLACGRNVALGVGVLSCILTLMGGCLGWRFFFSILILLK